MICGYALEPEFEATRNKHDLTTSNPVSEAGYYAIESSDFFDERAEAPCPCSYPDGIDDSEIGN